MLAGFVGVEVRGVLRATESYAELARMLWHPVSLHDEAAAATRATELLTDQGRARPSAPSDPVVVAAEVAELLRGDIPFFATTTSDGQLTGPAGARWGEPHDLVDAGTGQLAIRRSGHRAGADPYQPDQRVLGRGLAPRRPALEDHPGAGG